MKKIFALSTLLAYGFVVPTYALISVAQKNARLAHNASRLKSRFLVVLDPGHGGIDHGTTYEGNPPVAEKDLSLMLARQVAAHLKAQGISVILTRDGDYEMPLAARTALANEKHADVFLSIHLNSMPGTNPELASGVETYILNHETDSTSRRLAQLENQVIAGGVAKKEGEDVALILKDLQLDALLPESKRLACLIQQRVASIKGKKSGSPQLVSLTVDRGVKQALFFVLLGADMPSALVEAGFLSNPSDRDWLLSVSGQKAFAQAVARAVHLFRIQKNTPQAQRTLSSCKVR